MKIKSIVMFRMASLKSQRLSATRFAEISSISPVTANCYAALVNICNVFPFLGVLISLFAYSPTMQAQVISPLLDFRFDHASATGPDGQIYVVGGQISGSEGTKTLEKYNPLQQNATWVAAASMSVERDELAFVFGTDGYLYAIGGNIGNTVTNLVERYNTATNTWSTMAPLNVARSGLAAAVGPDGRIYAIGGYGGGSSNLSSVEVYNPPSNTNPLGQWVPAPAMNSAMANHNAVTGLDGNIYVFDGPSGNLWKVFNGTQWTPKGSLSFGIGGFDAVTGPNGLMYQVGVDGGLWAGSAQTIPYTSTGPSSTVVPDLIKSRNQAAATVAEGYLFVTGGYKKSFGAMKDAEKIGTMPAPVFQNTKSCWKFNEPNGQTVVDNCGTNTGTIVGNAIHDATGRVGRALIFNGTNQHVTVNNASGINFGTGSMSIEGWIKWSPVNGVAVVPILDKRTQANGKYQGYHLFVTSGGKLGFQLANGSTYQNYGGTQTTIPANQWTHIAVTVDRSSMNPAVSIYVNSVLDKTFVPLQGDISTAAPLMIGKHSFNTSYFKGELDELSLYNRALRWAEIRAVFLAGKAGKQ